MSSPMAMCCISGLPTDMALRRSAILLYAAVGLAAPCSAAGYRDFGAWIVGCDNIGACRALGFRLDGGLPASPYVVLDREAGTERCVEAAAGVRPGF